MAWRAGMERLVEAERPRDRRRYGRRSSIGRTSGRRRSGCGRCSPTRSLPSSGGTRRSRRTGRSDRRWSGTTAGVTIVEPEQIVLEYDPPRRLSYTWHTFTPERITSGVDFSAELMAKLTSEHRSRVTFEIEPLGDNVKLTVVHDDFQPGSTAAEMVSEGWSQLLSSLRASSRPASCCRCSPSAGAPGGWSRRRPAAGVVRGWGAGAVPGSGFCGPRVRAPPRYRRPPGCGRFGRAHRLI